MIFNIPAGGKKKVLCSFLGAVGETFTVEQKGVVLRTGLAEGETLELKQGEYQVTGSLSAYRKTVAVKSAGAYGVYPDGAIYWYGREVYPMTTSLNQGYSSAAATENTNNIDLYAWANSNVAATSSMAQTITQDLVDTAGYSAIRYEVTVESIYEKYSGGTAQINLGHRTATGYTALTNAVLTAVADKQTYSVTVPTEPAYIGAQAYAGWGGNTGNYYARAYVHAIWME